MKKIISLLIAFVFALGNLAFASNIDDKITVVDLTDVSVIGECGFPATGEQKRSGNYTLLWAESDLYRDIKLKCTSDWQNKKYLEFWVYSAYPTNSKFTLMINADNYETQCLDYYYTTINVSWSGWRLFSFDLEKDLTTIRNPKGFSNVEEIKLLASFNGETPVMGTKLYFDKMYTTNEKSTAASDVVNEDESSDFMIADFSKSSNVVMAGFSPSSKQVRSGDVSLKWAGEDLKRAPLMTNIPEDWTPYSFLDMWIYSETATNSRLVMGVSSENPQTQGNDYYYYNITVDWTGWKHFSLPLGTGAFQVSRNPLGWNKISGYEFWPGFGGEWLDPKTVLYVDRISLTTGNSTNMDKTDYIIPSQSKEGDINVSNMIKQNMGEINHPRMLMTAKDFENLKTWTKEDEFLTKIASQVIEQAESYLEAPIQKYEKPDGLRLPTTAASRLPVLSMAYQLTGDTRYAQRAWTDIESVCKFPDWNPGHFLDVGDTARHVALCYDWLYDYFDDSQRRTIRNGIVKNAFGPSIDYYRTGEGFTTNTNNWNQVINSGIAMAAVAIADDVGYEGLANEIINRSFESMPMGTKAFEPDGACPEGPAYWGYTQWGYFQYIGSLVSAAGDDFGFAEIHGMKNTGYFPVQLTGPTGRYFNFADASAETFGSGALFFLSAYNNQPELANFMIQTGGGDYTTLMYYRKNDAQNIDYKEVLPQDALFKGQQNVAAIRSSWKDKNASFVSFKGGDNQASHGDLDIGSFVFESLNYRWFVELGREVYEYPGMWDFGINGGRWNYYRKRAEGQNTLVINANQNGGQYPYAKGEIYKMNSSANASYGLIDMSDAYKDDVTSAKRGIALVNNRDTLIVQDEIKTKKASEIYSFFHTYADIVIAEDGKTAILSNGKDKLRADIISQGSDAVFKKMEATPFPTSPLAENSSNNGITKLAVYIKNAVNPTISVAFTPIKSGMSENVTLPKFIALNVWDSYLNDSIGVNNVMINSVELDNFDADNKYYLVDDGIIGTVEAVADENTDVVIIQAEKDGDVAIIEATSKTTGQTIRYGIEFRQKRPGIFVESLDTYEIKGVFASDVPQETNIPENTFDNDLNTRWSSEGMQWIYYDLGEMVYLSDVLIAFMNGEQRNTFFDIEVSDDAQKWSTVYKGQNSGTSNEKEQYSFTQVKARYVRINCRGNTVNDWNSITEIGFPKPAKGFADTQGHWAKKDIEDMANINIVNGIGDNLFSPDSTVTRGQFITMVVKVCNFELNSYNNIWTDVNSENWYANILQTAFDAGIINQNMIDNNQIYPEREITREEMCSVIVSAYEKLKNTKINSLSVERFDDKDNMSNWAKPFVEKGLGSRLISGKSGNYFGANEFTTRAEAAVIVKRLLLKMI